MFALCARIQHLLRDHKICPIRDNGFCAVAGEGELNRRRGLGGQKLMSSAYSKMAGSRGYDLTCNILRASKKLLPSPPNLHNYYLIQTKSSQRQPEKRYDILYLWSRSKCWMRAHKRTFNAQRLKSQIWTMGFRCFVSFANSTNQNT